MIICTKNIVLFVFGDTYVLKYSVQTTVSKSHKNTGQGDRKTRQATQAADSMFCDTGINFMTTCMR